MYAGLQVKCPLLFQGFDKTRIFSEDFFFRNILKYQTSRKSFQKEPSGSMWPEGGTDMMKLTLAFRNFTNAPKNQWWDTRRMELLEQLTITGLMKIM
jgi:hypothetical protein